MRRTRWLVLGIVITALLSAAALAPAKGIKISQDSEDFTVGAGAVGGDEADCGGKRAVSGGFFGEFESGGGVPAVIPLVSMRKSEPEWSSRALNIGGGSGDATVYAYCAKKKKFPKLRQGSEDETLTAPQVFDVTAECPGNRRAISGGFEIPDSFTVVTTSMRSGRGSWTVEFRPVSSVVEVEAFVYCAKGVKLKQRSSETSLSSGEVDTEEARCKRNQRVVSGGFDTDSDGVNTVGIGSASRRAGKRAWEATANAGLDPQDLTVYAYCLKQPKKK
jgi:hypothetical protein